MGVAFIPDTVNLSWGYKVTVAIVPFRRTVLPPRPGVICANSGNALVMTPDRITPMSVRNGILIPESSSPGRRFTTEAVDGSIALGKKVFKGTPPDASAV